MCPTRGTPLNSGFRKEEQAASFRQSLPVVCSRRVDAAFRSNEPTCVVPRDRYRKTTEISFSLYHSRHRTHTRSMSVVFNVFASVCVRRVSVVIINNSKPVSCHPLFPNRLPQEGGTSSVFSTIAACRMFAVVWTPPFDRTSPPALCLEIDIEQRQKSVFRFTTYGTALT